MNKEDILNKTTGDKWQRIGGIKKRHGIDVHISSLHTKESSGVGEFLDLIPLIDWVKSVGMQVVQLLPLNDSGRDPSPYNVLSSCALNPVYLSLSSLPDLDEGLLTALTPLKVRDPTPKVPYQRIEEEKTAWLKLYFEKNGPQIIQTEEYKDFQRQNGWLREYAQFKDGENIDFHQVIQFLCTNQLKKVKAHAESQGILLMGDIPILVSSVSADVVNHPEIFDTSLSAGAPPDPYNWDGQSWGFPLFKWDVMRAEGYKWWKERIGYASNFYDIYRIDHIVGFFRIWAVPHNSPPKEGKFLPEDESLWMPAGKERIQMMVDSSRMLPIAEDLGVVDPKVRHLLEEMGICGTKVMRWERYYHIDNSFILPEDYPVLSLTTVSTHDSETLQLWWQNCPQEAIEYAAQRQWVYNPILSYDQRKAILWDSHHTPSLFHINLLQEYLAFFPELVWENPEDERINIPGAIKLDNWTYRLRPSIEELLGHDKLRSVIKELITQ